MERQANETVAPSALDSAAHPLDAILKADSPQLPREGDIVEGPVVSRGTAAVFVDLGPQGTGIVYGREFFMARDILRDKRVGDRVSAKVIDPENADGYVELSAVAAGRELAWGRLQKFSDEKETIKATVESANRGGLVVNVEGIKAFLPVSQLAPEHYPHVEGGDKEKILEALRAFVGQPLSAKILNLDPQRDKLILSERAVFEEELREELKNFHVGDIVEGRVAGIVDFGLFVRFGPDERLEGLMHVSEVSREPVQHIRERFTIGDRLKAKIVDIQSDRVSLSLKALEPPQPETATPSADGEEVTPGPKEEEPAVTAETEKTEETSANVSESKESPE